MTQQIIILVLTTFFSTSSLSSSKIVAANKKTQFQPNTFYIIEKSTSVQKELFLANRSLKPNKNCRNKIKNIMCLVDPAKTDQGSAERKCLPGGKKYASHFEALHDNYPKAFQRIFCSLNVIYIEKKFFGTAYAGIVIDDDGNMNGAMMGVRKSVIDENLDLMRWASWKEQLSFGGNKNDYQVNQDLPLVKTKTINNVNDFLYFLVAHEFGHIFDFSNNVNEFTNCLANPEDECGTPRPGSWSEFSWVSDRKVLANDDFHKRDGLCFYGCQNTFIAKEDTSQLYKELHSSSFISTYAATNPWDDFAESLAYIAMEMFLMPTYFVSFDGEIFNITSKLHEPIFKEKRNYVIDFLNKTDIVYP